MRKIILIVFLGFMIIAFSCEPVSVSVNSNGEVAFTREEGVFFVNFKTDKLSNVIWNKDKKSMPVIVRWSNSEELFAYTLKNTEFNSTELYICDKAGKKTKSVFSISNPILQVEWSNDDKYITISTTGDDTELGVADIHLISVADGMSKKILTNVGDLHKWYSNEKIINMNIIEKNTTYEAYLGSMSLTNIKNGSQEIVLYTIVSKEGGLDYSPKSDRVVFSALSVDSKKTVFPKELDTQSFAPYSYDFKTKSTQKISDSACFYIDFSPNEKNILLLLSKSYSEKILATYSVDKKQTTTVVNGVLEKITNSSSSANLYPNWLNDSELLYFVERKVYGSNGVSLSLFSIDISSQNKKNRQLFIDTEIDKLIKEQGGY